MPYYKKGYFDEVSIDIRTRNNCPKVNVPTLTVFYCINLRQTQKDPEKDIMNYVNFKIFAQVNRTRNASESKIYETKNEDPDSDFVNCTFPIYEGQKLLGVYKHTRMISMLGDPAPDILIVAFQKRKEASMVRSEMKEAPKSF